MFQHKDRVVRFISDEGIEQTGGSPRVYVINKDKNRELNSLFAYPEVRLDDEGLVIRTSTESKWNLGDKVLFHHADAPVLEEVPILEEA